MFEKDISCANCSHKEVCSLKEDFEKAQRAVDDCSVTLGETQNGVSFKRLRDFDFIERVKLRCKHFSSGGITLRADGSAEIR